MNRILAPTPPMGWNSWDNYGASVTEQEVLANAQAMHEHLLSSGWDTVVVDIQWYEPHAQGSSYRPFVPLEMDEFSRLIPAVNRFPSSAGGQGFGPLAKRVHDLGLKFGIHMMRGIPRQAVHQASAVLGTHRTARQIAHTASICPWNTDMHGVDPSAEGAQKYYDSLMALYASWGVDFVKVDDILSPLQEGEIDLIRNALDRCGRDMVLSLSCGPTSLESGPYLSRTAEMWRTTSDFWDRWKDLRAAADMCAKWAPFAGDGHWPDADMLPLGKIAQRSEEAGTPDRRSQFTADEQCLLMTLWCIARSPLMLGANLTELDAETLSLLVNDEVLAVHRRGDNAREIIRTRDIAVWRSELPDDRIAFAILNLSDEGVTETIDLASLRVPNGYTVRDLWSRQNLEVSTDNVKVAVPAHGARLFSASPSH